MLSENRLGVISLALCERQISYIYLCSTLEKGVHNIDDFKMLRSCFRTLIRKNCCNELIWSRITVIGRLYRETDTVLKKLLILIKY
jgi:hypothetical protein